MLVKHVMVVSQGRHYHFRKHMSETSSCPTLLRNRVSSSGFDCGAGDVAGGLMALELIEANAEDEHDF